MNIFPKSHELDYCHNNEDDIYQFNSLKESDCLNIDLEVGQFFMAPQRLVHSGGPSKNKVIHLDDKSMELPYTHVALHVDFCLSDSIFESTVVNDTTCYVSLNDDSN